MRISIISLVFSSFIYSSAVIDIDESVINRTNYLNYYLDSAPFPSHLKNINLFDTQNYVLESQNFEVRETKARSKTPKF